MRRGNPKSIHDWPDLIRSDVRVITPNPKVSSGGRWNYLAAWGYALKASGDTDDAAARDFVARLYRNVPILDTGARAGDADLRRARSGRRSAVMGKRGAARGPKIGADKFTVVVPPVSILAEPPVALVDKNVDIDGTRPAAEAYLRYLYSPDGAADYRPKTDTGPLYPTQSRRNR